MKVLYISLTHSFKVAFKSILIEYSITVILFVSRLVIKIEIHTLELIIHYVIDTVCQSSYSANGNFPCLTTREIQIR